MRQLRLNLNTPCCRVAERMCQLVWAKNIQVARLKAENRYRWTQNLHQPTRHKVIVVNGLRQKTYASEATRFGRGRLPAGFASAGSSESFSFITRPTLNFTVRFSGTWTRSRVLGF